MNNHQENITQQSSMSISSTSRTRLRLLQIAILILFGVVIARLVQIQILDSQKYREIAQRQYQAKIVLPAIRGSIYDRNGIVIASNSMIVSLAADPMLASEDVRSIANTFSKIFGKPKQYYLQKLHSDSRFVWLERKVNGNFLRKINVKHIEGLVVLQEPKRLYYHEQLAGQLIGCTDIDNKGIAGVELAFDAQLRGKDGYVVFQRDGLGRARPSVDYPRQDPINGHGIVLTIDLNLQAIAEKELKKGIEKNKAEGGIVILLQPKTGEVLALAQYPSINSNDFGDYNLADQKLRAVTDLFEPGSLFKIVTASAALEHDMVTLQKEFFAENGVYVVSAAGGKGRKITDMHKYGWLTFQEAMEVSSNIVMAKVSDLIGSERFYRMSRNYGFGVATNVGFPGEVKGVLKKPVEWSGTTLNSLSFGYEVGVTPIQIAVAYAAVANNGMLMKPYIFAREQAAMGQTVWEAQPEKIRNVISESTAQTLKGLFEGVVERGTGAPAKIPGVRIAGKTGTSRKYIEGRYETGTYTASFVGFFPVEDPQIVCLVMMDNPRGDNYTGGTTSAPVFRAIAEQLLNYIHLFKPIAPMAHVSNNSIPERDLPPKNVHRYRITEEKKARAFEAHSIPDVRGYSVRRAITVLTVGKFQPIVNGSGTVVSQIPTAGQPATEGMKITLVCQPKAVSTLTAR
ncbi:MAG: PASTA domain-containing protein [Ignavibacteriae bacterium]|nr:PASTA domain-containing protein [Ignavibacteriota bacterium]